MQRAGDTERLRRLRLGEHHWKVSSIVRPLRSGRHLFNSCRDGRHQGKVGIVDATKNVLNVLNSEHGATDGSVIKTKAWTMLTADGHPSTRTSITDKLVKRLPFHCRGRKLSLPSEFGNQRIPVIRMGREECRAIQATTSFTPS